VTATGLVVIVTGPGLVTKSIKGFDLPENCEMDLLLRASLLPEYAEAEDIVSSVMAIQRVDYAGSLEGFLATCQAPI